MRHALLTAAAAAGLAPWAPSALASDLTLDGQSELAIDAGSSFTARLTGGAGLPAFIAFDVDPGPTDVLGDLVDVGFSPLLTCVAEGQTDASGVLESVIATPSNPGLAGIELYFAGVVFDPADANGLDFSNGVVLSFEDLVQPDLIEVDLFGVTRPGAPFFDWVRVAQDFEPIQIAIDPSEQPQLAGQTVDVYLVADRTQGEWNSDASLVDVSGDGPNSLAITATDVPQNTFTIDSGSLTGPSTATFGRGFDIVVDVDGDGLLSAGDLVDGYTSGAGLFVCQDPSLPGPYDVVETLYSGGNFLGQNLFYPANAAELDQLHLVIVSHGNGHNYQLYDHIGNHLASYGYEVMSHQNNTQPGIFTSSTTTLNNTQYFLANLDTIAGGILDGRIVRDEITWIGHSRGGEGIVRAYDRLVDDLYTSEEFDDEDIALLSSMAPTVFQSAMQSDPHEVDYHLWTGASDSDVNGCAIVDTVQPYQLFGRAGNQRQAIGLYGVGHAWFHNGSGAFAAGPCQVGREQTHEMMRGYLLPLIEYHIRENEAGRDWLVRQYEDLRPLSVDGEALNACLVANLIFEDGIESGKLVIEDYQSNTGDPLTASSGAVITTDIDGYWTGRANDANTTFTFTEADPFNGMTHSGASDREDCGILLFTGGQDRSLSYDLAAGTQDWSAFDWLSFRAAQSTRSPETIAILGDLDFTVRLVDTDGDSAEVSTASIGAGIEEPYQRNGCGDGTGWNNEYETVRMGLRGFRSINPDLDLASLDRLEFLFGPSWGEAAGRLAFDSIEVVRD
ncbi:MAG: hypothetical protein AAFZ65_13030 [Planctomycetota bacterium]